MSLEITNNAIDRYQRQLEFVHENREKFATEKFYIEKVAFLTQQIRALQMKKMEL